MKFIEDLNLKLVYEKEIADVISRNNVDSKKLYELKTFKDQVGNDKVLLIPTNDEVIKPIRVIFEGE